MKQLPTQSNGCKVEDRIRRLGLELPTTVAPAANYALAVLHDGLLHLSGQLPRVGDTVAVTGRVGVATTLAQAQHGARLCMLRALAVLRQQLGSLGRVERIVKLCVYVQSGPDFTQQSEVADAASEILYAVFASAGGHARTAVGVYQLPKNAAVELDLIVAVHAASPLHKDPADATTD